MAVLADPTGAAFRSWQPGRTIGAERVNEPGTMGWNELAMEMAEDQWPADAPPHWTVYFPVADPDAAATLCEELGGTITMAPFDTPAGRMGVLSDPRGAAFSVIDPAAPQS